MASSNVVKENARIAMRGHFLQCVIAACTLLFTWLILLYCTSLLEYVSGSPLAAKLFFIALVLLLVAPLTLGLLRYYRNLMWGCSENVIEIFFFFSYSFRYIKALEFTVRLALRFTVICLLVQLPSFITQLFSSPAFYRYLGLEFPAFVPNLWILTAFLRAAGYVALFLLMLRYYLAPFLYVSSMDPGPKETLRISAVIARGNAIDFVALIFSFLPLLLLSFLMLPLPFTLPYFLVSYLVHARFAAARYNRIPVQTGRIPEDRL